MDNFASSNSVVVHIGEPVSNTASVLLLIPLVWILDGRQVLLLLVQVVLVHLFLELDVLFVNSIDLLSEVLVLPLESLDQLILLFDLLDLIVVHGGSVLHFVPETDELLGLWDNLDEGLLLSVAGWLALVGLE